MIIKHLPTAEHTATLHSLHYFANQYHKTSMPCANAGHAVLLKCELAEQKAPIYGRQQSNCNLT